MPDTCVKCGSDNISAEGMITEGSIAYCNVTCAACGAKYTEKYAYFGYTDDHIRI